MRLAAFAVLAFLMVLLLAPSAFAGNPPDIKTGVEVKNSDPGGGVVYVWIDSGRLGDKVQADKVQGPDGKDLPAGLIIMPKGNRSFGDAIGFGTDWPTLHLWVVQGNKATEKQERAS